MKIIKKYSEFNFRRYGNPWVAMVSPNGKIDFNARVGSYTGGYNKGEAGSLYVTDPIEGAVYAYGQKDYRGNNGGYEYVKFIGGEFVKVAKEDLVEALNG
ncbi:MAG TPA: hypothetical protein PKN45_11765 [Candidatus Limiplasma sp.]|nr:hypothetical protein [Candidatus Limiplasma sp.]